MVPCSAHECAIVDYPHRLSAPPHATDQTPGTLVKIKLAHIAGCSWIYIYMYIFPLIDMGESKVQTKFRPILNPGCWYTPNSLGVVLVQTP
jgi:hypothetical protein